MSYTPVVQQMAKRIFFWAHPRRHWVAHPDYKQSLEQERYLTMARALHKQAVDDYLAEAIEHRNEENPGQVRKEVPNE